MNRIMWITAFIMLCLFSAVYLTVDAVGTGNNDSSNNQSQIVYTVKEYEGKIAVFIDGNESPERILESPYIRDLPQYDRDLLKIGIPAYSETELNTILEDYDE